MKVLSVQRWLLLVFGALALFLSSTAGAQDNAGADDAETPWGAGVSKEAKSQALALFREANNYFAESQYSLAAERYQKAIKHWDHPSIQFNLAVSLINMDEPLKAYSHLRRALRYKAQPFKKSRYSEALTYEKLLLGRLAKVEISCKEAGAVVTLDGKEVLKGPGEHEALVAPGSHQVVATKSEFATYSETVRVVPGEPNKVQIKMVTLESQMVMKRPLDRKFPWIVAGAGVAAMVLGVPVWMQAGADASSYDRELATLCPEGCHPDEIPGDVANLKSRSQLTNTVAMSLFVVGGVAAAAGVGLMVYNQPRAVQPGKEAAPASASATVTVTPLVSRDLTGFGAIMRF